VAINIRYFIFIGLFFASIILASCKNETEQENTEYKRIVAACDEGKIEAKKENYSSALIEWGKDINIEDYKYKSDVIKEKLRAILLCLQVSGISKNGEEGQWFEKAAAQGSSQAQLYLGMLYGGGRGGKPQDIAKAMEWLQLSSKNRNKDAEFLLMKLKEAEATK